MAIARAIGSVAASPSCCATGATTDMPLLYPISTAYVPGLQYAGSTMVEPSETPGAPRRRINRWALLLLLPYLGLCFPQLYARSTPALWGFPFFYWYQCMWVILASLIMGLVYRKLDK